MGQDLTTSSTAALPAVDLREPSTLLFLPPWLGTQLASVSDLGAGRTIVDPVTRQITGRVATIPRSKMPNGPQRAAIMQRIEELHEAARPGPMQTTLAILGELVNEHAPSRLDDDTADIKIGAYLDAVGDLPAWAIREAVRRWRRGDVSGDARDLDFAPKPARLRRLADSIRMVATGQAARLQRILDAEAEDELSDADLKANSARMSRLLADLTKSENRTPEAGSAHADRLQALSTLREAEAKARSQESEGVRA
jgi:hypothetical protein